MADNFDNVIDHLITNEGGYVNDPMDTGGRTIYGVTWRAWIAHLQKYAEHKYYLSHHWVNFHSTGETGFAFFDVKKFGVSDFKALSPNDVKFFYKKEYWQMARCDLLPAGVDYYVFDFAVNSGVSRAAKFLQRIVGTKDDGIVGQLTIAATNDYCRVNGTKRLLKELDRQRKEFLAKIWNAPRFLKGWKNRLTKVMAKCYELVDDVYLDTTKPLSESKTIKAASNEAKVATAMIAVGAVAPPENSAIDLAKTVTTNIEVVNTMTRVIHGFYEYGWTIPCVIMIGFAGYYAFNRYKDWFRGKE